MKTDKLKKAEAVEKSVEKAAAAEKEIMSAAEKSAAKKAAAPAKESVPAKSTRARKTAKSAKEEPAAEAAAPAAVPVQDAAEEKAPEKKAARTTRTAAKKVSADAAAAAEKAPEAKPAKRAAVKAVKAPAEKKAAEEKKPAAAKKAPAARKTKKEDAFSARLAARRQQLQSLYLQQFAGDEAGFDYLEGMLRSRWEERSQELRTLDESRSAGWYQSGAHAALTLCAAAFAGTLGGVQEKLGYLQELGADFLRIQDLLGEIPGSGMSFAGLVRPQLGTDADLAALTAACRKAGISLGADVAMDRTDSAHPWTAGNDGRYHQGSQMLNYGAAITFNDMASGLLRLANAGVELLFLNGLSRMAVAEHQSRSAMVRMLRLICEIVCPCVALVGEGGAAFLGTAEEPGCHLLTGADAAVWHTLATGDVSLLRRTVGSAESRVNSLLSCRGLRWDDLDFAWLEQQGMQYHAHIQYLNDYYTGAFQGSDGRGILRDGALWGTAASLCGVEAADFEQNGQKLEKAVARLNLLYGWLLTEGGIPAIQSGDEIGQLNDYNDHNDPYLSDAAVVCRGSFSWPLAEMRNDGEMRQGKHYLPLHRALEAWHKEPAFRSGAEVWTEDTGSNQVLAVLRRAEGRTVAALFNFSGNFVTAGIDRSGAGTDLVYGVRQEDLRHVTLYPYSYAWLLLEDK